MNTLLEDLESTWLETVDDLYPNPPVSRVNDIKRRIESINAGQRRLDQVSSARPDYLGLSPTGKMASLVCMKHNLAVSKSNGNVVGRTLHGAEAEENLVKEYASIRWTYSSRIAGGVTTYHVHSVDNPELVVFVAFREDTAKRVCADLLT